MVETKDTPTETKTDFGELSKNFGNLNSELSTQLNTFNTASKELELLNSGDIPTTLETRKLAKEKRDIAEKEVAKVRAKKDKLVEDNMETFIIGEDKKYEGSNYTSPVSNAAKNWEKNEAAGKRNGYTNTKTNSFVKETKSQHVQRAAENAKDDPSRRGGRNSY